MGRHNYGSSKRTGKRSATARAETIRRRQARAYKYGERVA